MYFGETDTGIIEKRRLEDILDKKTSEKINLKTLSALQNQVSKI